MTLEKLILSNLIHNEEFSRKTIPFFKPEYFQDKSERTTFSLITEYVDKYNKFPSNEALYIELNNVSGLSEEDFRQTRETIRQLQPDKNNDVEWLVDKAEKFCQERAIYNAIYTSIRILDDKTGQLSKGTIPQLLSDALGVSFDTNIGHDFIEDAQHRYEFYHKKERKVPFHLKFFNLITKGGVSTKTLNVILAGTGVGKTLFMCDCAANNLAEGKNVLYITMEMSEEAISQRIDANLLDFKMDELEAIPQQNYLSRVARLKSKTTGKLIVKEYPTASVGAANFRHLLNELRIKKNFKPDIIYIDYINICISSRLRYGANVNSYTFIKAIAEELRGLAVEFDVPIITATQTTRSGYQSSDVGLEDTAESFGLPATADFMFALTTSEELEELNQIMVKQLKNRYADLGSNRRFVVGIDRAKMRLYDVEQSAQEDIMDGPEPSVFDNTNFGREEKERSTLRQKLERRK